MYFSGIADEAGADIHTQIKAIREIGWQNLEIRNVKVGDFPAANLHDISDAAFDQLVGIVKDSGVHVNCFAATIANWGKKIDEPFDSSLEESRRAIPRMKKLGSKYVRIMSFAVRPDTDDQMKEERFRRVREIYKMFNDEGLIPVHENCMNYGGMGWTYTLELIENVPGLRLVFDTGNPVFADDRTKPKPYPKQSAWEFYKHVRDHIEYIHIKDGIWNTTANKCDFCYPGEGHGDVKRILADLIQTGYDGGISIEPHVGAVFHDDSVKSDEESKYRSFVEYGRRLNQIMADIKK